ncbi:MAG: UbiA family prenyltransferase [Weeksellaceae bacterium]
MQKITSKRLVYKLVALFAVIRGYNVGMLVLAMYITAYFIFSHEMSLFHFLENLELHIIILASAFTVSGGYIINNFYDLDKDTISRPLITYVSRFISQNLKLWVYISFSLISVALAFMASWRVGIFFIAYNFLVWFYSHKISKITFINNLFYVVLSLMPFLALLLYYNNYSLIIFMHGIYLSLLLLSIDLIKDLTTYKADLIYNYKTLPVAFGIKYAKIILTLCLALNCGWAIYMSTLEEIGHMSIYFKGVSIILILIIILLWVLKEKWKINLLYLLLKVILGVGVLSIAWIKINPLALQRLLPIN